jgi:YVTN family beta-propeller protein
LDRSARRIPLGPSPEFVRMRGDTAYVTYEPSALNASGARPAEVAVINPRTGSIVRRMPSGIETEGLAFSGDGSTVAATNEGDETLTISDANTGAQIRKVDTRQFGARPRGIARLPNDGGYAVTFESSSTLAIFDNAFNLVRKVSTGTGPYGVAFDASGKRLLVAAARAGLLQVFDSESLSLLREVPVGRRCWHFTFTPDNRNILIACGRSNEVEVIDAANYRRVTAIRGLDMPWGVVTWPKSYGTLDAPEPFPHEQHAQR